MVFKDIFGLVAFILDRIERGDGMQRSATGWTRTQAAAIRTQLCTWGALPSELTGTPTPRFLS